MSRRFGSTAHREVRPWYKSSGLFDVLMFYKRLFFRFPFMPNETPAPSLKPRRSSINVLLIAAGTLVLFSILGAVGLMSLVKFLHHRSERELVATVAEISPGTEFLHLLERFG